MDGVLRYYKFNAGANKLSGINLNGFKANNFPTLQILDISENNIGNKGIELLVKS